MEAFLGVKREVEARGRRCLVIEAEMATAEGPVTAAREALEAWGVPLFGRVLPRRKAEAPRAIG